jgi:hypothetical protein
VSDELTHCDFPIYQRLKKKKKKSEVENMLGTDGEQNAFSLASCFIMLPASASRDAFSASDGTRKFP